MPLFDYECEVCGLKFEALVRSKDDEDLLKCPNVSQHKDQKRTKLKKLISTFAKTAENWSKWQRE